MIKNLLIVSYEEFSSYIGINTRIEGMIDALRQNGVYIELVVPDYSRKIGCKEINTGGIKITKISIPNLFGKLKIPIISRIIFVIVFNSVVLINLKKRKHVFDYIQSEQIYPFLCCYMLAKRFKGRVILDEPVLLEYLIDDKLKRFKLLNYILKKMVVKFESFVYKFADYIICSSQKTMNYVNERVKGNKNNLYYLPNGVDIKKYTVRKKIKSNSKIFFNCSLPFYQNVAALRNIEKIIRYFEIKNFNNYSFTIIVNDISLFPKDLLDRFKINHNVIILSAVKSLVSYLQKADIVVFPFEHGHFSMAGPRLKVLEALSCGKIIMSTPEGVDGVLGCIDGENIIICSDFMDMAIKLINMIENRYKTNEMINKIQNGARRLIEEHYDWNKLINIYDKIGR